MELLGYSLHDLQACCGGTFSLKTTLMIADQVLCRLEVLAGKGLVHNSIKGQNMAIGLGKNSKLIYLIDFGRTTHYRHNNGEVVMSRCNPYSGNYVAAYASLSHELGERPSPWDDLVSLAFLLVEWRTGSLPWNKATKDLVNVQLPLTKVWKGGHLSLC